MTARPLLVALLVAAVALPVGAVTGAPTVAQVADRQQTVQVQTPGNASANASFGTTVASFMQASAAEAQGEVGQGMFQARFNQSSAAERPAVVRERVDELQARLESLRERRAALLNDTNVTVADRAKAARLTVRIDALQRSINGTARAAERAGLNLTALEMLRKNAGSLSGQEVAAIATGLVDAGPPEVPGKTPDQHSGDRGRGNATDGARGNQSQSAGNTTDGSGPGNASDGGGSGGDAGDGQQSTGGGGGNATETEDSTA